MGGPNRDKGIFVLKNWLCASFSYLAPLIFNTSLALNQFGEVMPIGGVNEKIEGYFRVCKALGLDGKQGVIIPKRNQRHLLLDDEVVQAVKDGKFQIITIDHAQAVLAEYRKTLENNQSKRKSD